MPSQSSSSIYPFGFNSIGSELDTIVRHFDRTNFPEQREPLPDCISARQEVRIPRWPLALLRPQFEQQRAFEDQLILVP